MIYIYKVLNFSYGIKYNPFFYLSMIHNETSIIKNIIKQTFYISIIKRIV